MLEHPLSPMPRWVAGLETETTVACVGQGGLLFRRPAKGAGCRAARVLGSLRKYVNERGIAPTARSTDLRSRGLPEGEALQFTDQRLL